MDSTNNIDPRAICDRYTDDIYAKMRDDGERTSAYARAIAAAAPGKVCLDVALVHWLPCAAGGQGEARSTSTPSRRTRRPRRPHVPPSPPRASLIKSAPYSTAIAPMFDCLNRGFAPA